ncbi:MAG: DNA primase [Saprospiraceae bacterium]
MITKRSIERVTETARIEEVVGNFVNLRRRGVNLIGLCPFHNEKTPSFTVSPSKNIYKCFGCGKGGDSVNFVMEHEGYSYIESIQYLAKMYGIQLEEVEVSDEYKKSEEKDQSLFIINEWAKNKFSHYLFNTQYGSKVGLAYFKERGFREAIIKKFDLGFALDEADALTKSAMETQYNVELLKELGLTSQSNRDFFRNRVMFTIHNLSGKPIGFAGRIMGKNDKLPKYINSPESSIYNKRKTLYGLFFAKNEIRKQDFCYLVEGYTDVISLVQSGIENVVASSGTSLTTEQILLIKRYTSTIKVIYDGDAAGINAAVRGLEMIIAESMNVKLVILPENHDPDSFIQEVGTSSFQEYVEKNEKDFVLFKVNLLLKDAENDPIKKANVLKDIIKTLSVVREPILRSMYVRECSNIMKIDEKIIYNEINKLIKTEIKEKNLKRLRDENEDLKTDLTIAGGDEDKEKISQTVYQVSDAYQENELMKILLTKGCKIYNKETGELVVDRIISEIKNNLQFLKINCI